MYMELAELTKRELPLRVFFDSPTIAGLASLARGIEVSTEFKRTGRKPHPDIRSASPADVEQLCRFLHQGFAGNVPIGAWQRLFDYGWIGEKPDFGRVLTVGNDITGFIGAIYASRKINGRTGSVCNLTSWYVLPDYRGWGVELLAAAVSNKDLTYTALTPGPAATQMLEAMGFARSNTCKIALPPLAQIDTLLQRELSISFDPETIRRSLDDTQRQIFDDHVGCDCLPLSLSAGSEHTLLIVKRRVGGNARLNRLFSTAAKVAYSEILYCSDPNMLARHLERAKLAILRRQRTLLLVCDERLFAKLPKGLLFEAPALYRSSQFSAAELDKLYSELALIPI